MHKDAWRDASRAAAILLLAALVSTGAPPDAPAGPARGAPSCADQIRLGEDADLAALQQALARDLRRAGIDPAAALVGAAHFFRPFPGGNGRSCSTCHIPSEGFSISPATVEARWRRLQAARQSDACADDPLFRSSDADDGRQDYTLLRTRALFKVRVALPRHVRLADDPAATHVTLSRAVPPLEMLAHTAPYQQDRSVRTLEEQARGAVEGHMQPSAPPTPEFLASVAEFQRHLASSPEIRSISEALRGGRPVPDLDPPLSPLERVGKERFQDLCGRCHGGPAQVQNLEHRIFPPFDGSANPSSLNVVVSNPPPSGFAGSPIHGPGFDLPTQRFTVELPDGTRTVLVSSDPGTVLTDPAALEKVAGNQVFNRFDVPQLRGINHTAPYFHDHRARTLEEVVRHYQVFFRFLRSVRGLAVPEVRDEDMAPIVAYMKKAL
jgi:cytochrome c peroxidase